MQPRTEGNQRCVKFELTTNPRSRIQGYRDYLGNVVHHFDIPAKHNQLKITAEATVEIMPLANLPGALSPDAWAELDRIKASGEHWDYLTPSQFAFKTRLLTELATEFRLERRSDMRVRRSDIDDAPVLALLHLAHRGADGVERRRLVGRVSQSRRSRQVATAQPSNPITRSPTA